jgi:hypothetical protein
MSGDAKCDPFLLGAICIGNCTEFDSNNENAAHIFHPAIWLSHREGHLHIESANILTLAVKQLLAKQLLVSGNNAM